MRIKALFPALAVAASLAASPASAQSQTARDWAADMEMKVRGPFTMAAVGDVIIMRPMANSTDPGLQSALRVLQNSDVAFGNFAQGATLYDRMAARVEISTEDSDNFRRNKVTVLGETRVALAVKNTLAFTKGDFSDAITDLTS